MLDDSGKTEEIVPMIIMTKDGKLVITSDGTDEMNALVDIAVEVQEESDRGAAIVVAAVLESILEDLIAAFFENQDRKKDCFGNNGPIGTFSSKVLIAYSLGILSTEEFQTLDIIRRVRNDFAHVQRVSFQTQHIRDRCLSLEFAGNADFTSERQRFLANALVLMFQIFERPAEIAKSRTQVSIKKTIRQFDPSTDPAEAK